MVLWQSTARGYNAPCFEGMVHYYIGSVLMLLDNEDEKDKVSIVLAIQNEPKARYFIIHHLVAFEIRSDL